MDCFVASAPRNEGGRNLSRPPCIGPHHPMMEVSMGRYLLLWLLGIPLPILVLIYAFGGLNH
jgi:hypothetical protein